MKRVKLGSKRKVLKTDIHFPLSNVTMETNTDKSMDYDSSVDKIKEESENSMPLNKKAKLSGLYRPPTHDELQALKETESLYRTNFIKLQITEMLSEVRTGKINSELDTLLHQLKTHITNLSPSVDGVIKLCNGLSLIPTTVQYPLGFTPTSEIKGHFQFLPPTIIKIVGSHLLETGLKENTNINITILIPQGCLQAKDHLNYRYFHKRAIYLSIIAGHLLKKKKLFSSVHFSYDLGNRLLPILVLRPKAQSLSKYTFYIHTSINDQAMPLTKLFPDRNNVRHFAIPFHKETMTDEELPPTPRYNNLILLEMESRERHLHELYGATLECPNITDATLLCKIWLHQRQLDEGYGCVSGFHCGMLMIYLLQRNKINQFMSSYQLFRIVLQFIASSDWSQEGISLADRRVYPSLPSLELYHSVYDVVFLDSSGCLNITANTSLYQYQVVRQEALLSHTHLDDDGNFNAVFLKPVLPILKYDALCKLELSEDIKGSSLIDHKLWNSFVMDSGGWVWPQVLNRVLSVISKGLGGRTTLIGQCSYHQPKWAVSEAPPTLSNTHMTVGLVFNTEVAFQPLILGPPADSPEAIQFRSFWGDRSELRRFPDSSIKEAVLWVGQGEGQKQCIPQQIIQHLLERHVAGCNATLTHTIMDIILHRTGYGMDSTTGALSTGEEESVNVVKVFTELSRQLRLLKGLPLNIATVQGISPIFSQTEVYPPCPCNGRLSSRMRAVPQHGVQQHCLYPSCNMATPSFVYCFKVVIQMETSGKWPEDPSSINDIKTAFYLSISQSLQKIYHIVCAPTKEYIDVFKEGYVFRLFILYPREITLLKETKKESLLKRAIELEQYFVARPLLTSVLSGLQTQFLTYGPGTRLCKRWVSAHLLTNHIPEEVIELLVAFLFLHPSPFTVPGTPCCVFLRFLSLLVSHDWSHDPLIINLNDQFTADKLSEITTQFNNNRDKYPLMFIATPLDTTSQWTKDKPTPPIMNRLLLLAKASLDLLTNQISSLQSNLPSPLDFKQVFRTPLSDYNLIIYLNKVHVPRQSESITPPPTHTSLSNTDPSHLPVVDFDPVSLYVQALETAYDDLAMFFYDKYGGHIIGVVWKQQSFKPRPFKISEAACRIKQDTNSHGKCLVVPDVESLITDFQILGEGLVNKIEAPPISIN